jgi:hypothetical protein
VNRVWAACLAAAFTRSRFGGKAIRLCVRTLTSSRRLPSGWPFPPRVSFPSTASQVLRTSPTPDLSSVNGSGSALPLSPTGDQSRMSRPRMDRCPSPECLGLGWTDVHPQNLAPAIAVDADRDDQRDRHRVALRHRRALVRAPNNQRRFARRPRRRGAPALPRSVKLARPYRKSQAGEPRQRPSIRSRNLTSSHPDLDAISSNY